jgi:soluble lytic murein transglycosylase
MLAGVSRRSAAPLVLLATLAASSIGASCQGRTPPESTPPGTQATAASSAASAPAPSGSASASTAAVAPDAPPASFDDGTLHALIAEPALADVSRAMGTKSWRAAADALRKALDDGKLTGDDLARGRFLLGRLSALAKDDDGADAAYGQVPETSPLFAHAALRRATVAQKRGRADDALTLVAKVPEAAPFAVDRHMVQGEALAAKGDHAGAAAAFAAERRSARWVDASIRYAEEVVAQGAAGAPSASDAAKAARRVRVELPTSGLVARAEEAERKARGLLVGAAARVEPLSSAEQLQQAQAYLDAGHARDALATAAPALAEKKGDASWCTASLLVARAHERLRDRAKASKAYGDVAAACKDEATRAPALYDGAKLAASMKDLPLARARFAQLETAFPKHRLADDARLRGAQAAIDAGDVAKGEGMLAALPDDYPSGDMKSEALFRLALPRLKRGEWTQAAGYLEKSVRVSPRDDGYFLAGRASYFLARAKIASGAAPAAIEEGYDRLREVVRTEPLSFAASQAYARLVSRDAASAAAAKKAYEDALAAEPKGLLFDAARPELTTPGFKRAIELARVLDVDAARKELSALGLLRDGDEGGAWIAAILFYRVGDLRSAFAIPRGKTTEWTRHHPAGKWKLAWEIAFPRIYADVVEPAAATSGVPSPFIWAIMREESAFDPEATSPSPAYGLMQLILPTAQHYAKLAKQPAPTPQSLYQPDVNVPLGVSYLAKLRREFAGNPVLAVPSYNAGEGATHRWLQPALADDFDLWVESIPLDETRKYTKRVLASFWAYTALYAPERLDAELRAASAPLPAR